MKALAVGYDVLYDRLSETERQEVRDTIVAVGKAYYPFFQVPATAGDGYNKHHGSVDAAPFGVMALALLGEVDEASAWLDNAIEKHVNYLLPHALTPSGTNDQSSNFWASTLHYRIFFCDPLRRVTGRDLFAEFPKSLPGRIALAAVAGKQPATLEFNENNRSVLFAPSYGQIDYWSPALVYLARHHKRPIYQYLAFVGRIARLDSTHSLHHTHPQRGAAVLPRPVRVHLVRPRYRSRRRRKSAAVVRVSRAGGERSLLAGVVSAGRHRRRHEEGRPYHSRRRPAGVRRSTRTA